ncbi:hypothetical protein DPMN_025741 [Dreissena polymorpha]|uniref:Uncharacterized protein n=1 Tax=Dreissena polymorpha TaxID=45954 RepID=A0A9D4LS54_DREPO|nr:hypothetical protein DPMN_025741 [Dreissena polymorpha]
MQRGSVFACPVHISGTRTRKSLHELTSGLIVAIVSGCKLMHTLRKKRGQTNERKDRLCDYYITPSDKGNDDADDDVDDVDDNYDYAIPMHLEELQYKQYSKIVKLGVSVYCFTYYCINSIYNALWRETGEREKSCIYEAIHVPFKPCYQSERFGQWATPHRLSDVRRRPSYWIWNYFKTRWRSPRKDEKFKRVF